ncbi:MAG TPA: hypothetical protein VFZ65_00370 [Planctomycetota bacterium]|nr:hypothetical protein [Planctomycetota bacterium]
MNPTKVLLRSVALGATILFPAFATAQTTCPLLALDTATTTTSTLWDINTTTGVASNPRTVSGAPNRPPHCIDFSPSGVLYGLSLGGAGSPASGMLFTINPASGATTFVANLTQYVNVEGDIAFDPTTGILYAVDGGGPLYRVNTSTGACVLVGTLPADLPGGCDYSGLGFDSYGQLYVWSQFGSVLRKVDKTNGAIQSTVPLAPFPGGAVGDLAFDPGSGKCFLGGNPSGGMLSRVDPSTGVVTPIGSTAPMAGLWSMTFDPNNCARAIKHGNGCTTQFASFYELQAPFTQDLSGMMVIGTFNGSGYTITTVPGPGFSPLIGLAPVPLGDDASAPVGTLGMWVGSNGWLAQGPGNTTAPVPSIATFLNQPSPWLTAWTDLDPSNTAGGSVYYFEPSPGVAQATWYGVFGKGTTGPNYIQITWDTVTRDWSIEYGALSLANPQFWLTGYSPAGPSADPGPSDVSTFGSPPHTIALFDQVPLTLASIGRPIQGLTAVPFNLVTTNIDPSAVLHLGIIGLQSPGLPLIGLGLPSDCFLHASIDATSGPQLFPIGSQNWTALTLPALPPSVVGFLFYCQAVTLTTSGLGPTTRVSNGVKCVVGLL